MTTQPKALKPCPFCGGEAAHEWSNTLQKAYVKCTDCGASSDRFETSRIAANRWNKRHGTKDAGQ